MKRSSEIRSKIEIDEQRVNIPLHEIVSLVSKIFENLGCASEISDEVASH